MDKGFKRLAAILQSQDNGIVIHDLNKHRKLFWSDNTWYVLAQKTRSGSFSINLYSGPDLSEALEALEAFER